MVKKNYILLGLLVGIFLTSGCILQKDQGIDETEFVEKREENKQVNVVEITKEDPKETQITKELDLSRSFIFKAENGGYGTAEVTGYLTVVTGTNGVEKGIFNLIETNNLEFFNFVGKTKKMDLGCVKDLPNTEYTKLLLSNKDNLIKIQIAKAPSSPNDEESDCFTQLRNLKVIE